MGTYAELYSGKVHNTVPEDKKKEFAKRIERLFQEGGMMRIKPNILFGKRVYTIHKVKMGKNGVHFNYNYFEEEEWETAGFDKKRYRVFSEKLGHEDFLEVMVAAYMLEEQYVEETAVARLDGDNVRDWEYIGWINHLFDEHYHMKNFDSWKLFELFHELEESGYRDEEDIECASWNGYETQFDFGSTRYAFVAKCEIYAVLYGTEKAIEKYKPGLEEGTLELKIINCLEAYIERLNRYKKERELSEKEQLKELMEEIRNDYKNTEKAVCDSFGQKNLSLELVKATALLSDALAFVVKGIAEVYNLEFWDLWKQMGLGGLRHFKELYNQGKYYITPLSTAGFLKRDPDDLIYFWHEKAGFNFSKELCEWFYSLRMQFDIVIDDVGTYLGAFKEDPLRHIVGIMEAAEENYYHILTFTEFLEETKENIDDMCYWAFWMIYEEMIFSQRLLKAGSVIFAPEGTENKRNGFWEYKRNSKKALIDDWISISEEKRNNDGRKELRRYMALMANKKLRYKVFEY